MHWFDFFQARMTNPTHHPASTIRSPGSRFMSLLQKNPRVIHHVQNLRENQSANKVPTPLLDWETLRVQDSFCRGHDTADYGSATAQIWLHHDSPPQLLNWDCWITDVFMFSDTVVVIKAFYHFYILACYMLFYTGSTRAILYVQVQMSLYERVMEYLLGI